jgi:RNA polymerase sigma-70 factor (ECF subfamily)
MTKRDFRDDRELIGRYMRGERAAEEQLARRLACVPRFVRSIHAGRSGPLDEHDLADVIQEVLVTLIERLATFRGDASLETWAYRFCDFVLRNAIRGHHRDAPTATSGVELDHLPGAPDADGGGVDASTALAWLDAMDPRDAAILRVKYFDGLTFEAIAARSGLSTNTVKTRFYRALEKLRARVQTRTRG